MKIEAAVLRAPGQEFEMATLDANGPRAGEVLVQIAGCGLCHTDLVFSEGHRPYPLPAVLGHEGSGTVKEVGAGVCGFAPGDRVIIGFASCGHCASCDKGLQPYCRDFMALNFGASRRDGSSALSEDGQPVAAHFFGQSSFASHAVVPANSLIKVTETDLPLAFLGPLGCGLQTGAGAVLNALDCQPESSLAVIGGGPVGLAAVMAGAIRACSRIVLVELVAARRELALEVGATDVIDPANGDVAEQLRALLADGVDYIVDTTGKPEVMEAVSPALAVRGTLGLVGLPNDSKARLGVHIGFTMRYGQRVVGILEGDSNQQSFIPELLQFQRDGLFPFEKLISTYPLAQINEAIAAQARGECIKAVLVTGAGE